MPDIELWRIHHPHQILLRRRTPNTFNGIRDSHATTQHKRGAPLLLTLLNRHDATPFSRPLFHFTQHKVWGNSSESFFAGKFLPTPLRYANKPARHFHGNGLCRQLLTGDGQHIFRCRERRTLPIMKRQAALPSPDRAMRTSPFLRSPSPESCFNRSPTRSVSAPLPSLRPARRPAHHAGIPPVTLRPYARQSRRYAGRAGFTPRAPAPSWQASRNTVIGRFA